MLFLTLIKTLKSCTLPIKKNGHQSTAVFLGLYYLDLFNFDHRFLRKDLCRFL
jgi:hypothetical protein